MGNIVGSTNTDFCNLPTSKTDAYIIGLWCADGYHRTSSIGLSNTNLDLIKKFSEFLLSLFPKERLKLRVYSPDNLKRKQTAYHTYVNSRPLLRRFKIWKEQVTTIITKHYILPYFAGRFDGDGSVAKNFYKDCRIVYGNQQEAEEDMKLLRSIGFNKIKIYRYTAAHTFCLYVSRLETNKFLSEIYPYSIRLQKSVFVPRRDLATTVRRS